MFRYAIINDENIVVAIQSSSSEIVDDSAILIDDEQNIAPLSEYVDGVFIEPKKIKEKISLSDFRARFLFDEKIAIASSEDVGVHVLESDLAAVQEVDLTSINILQGLAYYVNLGILTSERVEEILSTDGND